MTELEFVDKMKEILDSENISMDTKLSDIEEWDSLSVVSFLALAVASSEKTVSREAVKACTDIKGLYQLL